MSDGRHRASDIRRRQLTVAAIVVGLLIAFGGGYLLARGGDDGSQASGSPSTTTSPTHTRSPRPTATASPSASATASPEPGNALPDGRSFVYAKKVVGSEGGQSLTFDLALFLTDQAAIDAATAHGDESPPPNGYYIVNDNTLLRTIPISPTVSIRRPRSPTSPRVRSADIWPTDSSASSLVFKARPCRGRSPRFKAKRWQHFMQS